MANVIDYLKWRGDIELAIDPFNIIDNLIFSELSYVPFEGMVSAFPSDEKVSLESVCKEYFKRNDFDEVYKRVKHSDFSQIMMKDVVETKRFRDVYVSNYVNEIDVEAASQFSAVTFHLPDNSVFISFRGTDHTITGWQEDFNMAYLDQIPGHKKAVNYVNSICEKYESVRIGGHSKGGNFAVYGAAFSDDKYFDRILEVFTNDGPGFREAVLNSSDYQRILSKVTSIIPKDAVVGTSLLNAYQHIIVESTAFGLEEHDIFSWKVEGKKLVEVDEIGNWSRVFSETVKEWLSEITDDDRKDFVTLMFTAVYELTGATVESFPDLKIILKNMEKHLSDFPKEKQKKFKTLFHRVAIAGGKELVNNYKFW